MTDNQLIRKFLKEKYPIGTEVWDSVRSGGPYVVNKRTVFDIFRWKKEDYNPDFLPDNPDKYYIEALVRNPGKNTVSYHLSNFDMDTVKYYFSEDKKNYYANRKKELKKLLSNNKK